MRSVKCLFVGILLILEVCLSWKFGHSKPRRAHPYLVRIEEGLISGYQQQYGNETIVVFKGVPYAEPPTKEDRFSHPKPKKPWDNAWDCSNYQRNCPNISPVSLVNSNGTEDCLYLNVFTNSRCFNTSCPVMFYIHGGSFFFGYPLEIKEEEIIPKYVSNQAIFITLSYRENIFGFLNFEDKTIDKNLANSGFHDILLALKFIKRNIGKMGGDPERITVMGNSSGASAILYMITSPKVPSDLFFQAWLSSPMPYISPNRNIEMTEVVTKLVGCTVKKTNNSTLDSLKQLKCLRRIPEQQLTEAAFKGLSQYEWTHTGPQTDEDLLPGQNFDQLLKNWKPLRLWISTTSNELKIEDKKSAYHLCEHYCPILGYTNKATFKYCSRKFDDRLRRTAQVYHSLTYKLAKLNAAQGKETFVEYFDQPNHTYHANDLLFVFGWHKPKEFTESEEGLDQVYYRWIVNFVKGEQPNKEFEPFTVSNPSYYYVNYQVHNNKTLIKPHMMYNTSIDPDGDQFWLHDLQQVETQAILNQSSSTLSPFHLSTTSYFTSTPEQSELNNSSLYMRHSSFNYHFMSTILLYLMFLVIVTVFILLWHRLQFTRGRTIVYLTTTEAPSERTPLLEAQEESTP